MKTTAIRINAALLALAALAPCALARAPKKAMTKDADAPVEIHNGPSSAEVSELQAQVKAEPAMAAAGQNASDGNAAASAPAASAAKNPDEKRIAGPMKKLNLNDPAKEVAVHAALADFFAAQRQWHAQNDNAVKEAWGKWSEAGKTKDKAKRVEGYAPVTAAYASFQPAHDKLSSDLGAQLSPEQVDMVKDGMTQGKVAFTMNGYMQMIPELTAPQKEYILGQLKQAREEGMNTTGKMELNNIFKAHKNAIEKYIDDQGYGFDKRFKDWVGRINAAKKPAAK